MLLDPPNRLCCWESAGRLLGNADPPNVYPPPPEWYCGVYSMLLPLRAAAIWLSAAYHWLWLLKKAARRAAKQWRTAAIQ